MEWNYDVDPCSCCGSHNHWSQDCPHSEQGYYQSDSGYQSNSYGQGGQQSPGRTYQPQNQNQGFQQTGPSGLEGLISQMSEIMVMLTTMKQQQDIDRKSNEALRIQLCQLSSDMSLFKNERNVGKLASDTERNPAHESSSSKNIKNVHINSVSRRSELEEEEEEEESDQGELLIPIQIGNFKTDNALVDYGSRVSVLPGCVFDKYDLGPLQQINASMMLEDYSQKRPRGILKGLIVKVGDFYYPEDFVVLNCDPLMEKQLTRVIIGRPFLATAHAYISFRNNTIDIDMTYGSRKLTINFFSHSYAYSFTDSYSWSNVTNKCHPSICEDDTKESVVMIDRSKDEKDVKNKVVKLPWWLKMRNKKSLTKSEKKDMVMKVEAKEEKPKRKKATDIPPKSVNVRALEMIYWRKMEDLETLRDHLERIFSGAEGGKHHTRPP